MNRLSHNRHARLPLFLFEGCQHVLQVPLDSNVTADGLDNTSRAGKQIRLVINTPESVEEMQTVSSGFSAEFGRAAGGLINNNSRSGLNRIHY